MSTDTGRGDVLDVLARILASKRAELAAAAEREPLAQLSRRAGAADAPRGFREALASRLGRGETTVIAEIKRASPSRGVLRAEFDAAGLARAYAEAGAAALSVLTDRDHFQGSGEDLAAARAASGLPVLRKDFVIDAYQVYEARAMAADAVLLIVAALGDAALRELRDLATHLGMDVLVEVHDGDELERALAIDPEIVGINNRDLRTFTTDTRATLRLRDRVPEGTLLVTESGIHGPADVTMMRAAGVNAFLVGESLMTAPDPGERLRALIAA